MRRLRGSWAARGGGVRTRTTFARASLLVAQVMHGERLARPAAPAHLDLALRAAKQRLLARWHPAPGAFGHPDLILCLWSAGDGIRTTVRLGGRLPTHLHVGLRERSERSYQQFSGAAPRPARKLPTGPLGKRLTHAHATHIHTSGRSGTPCRPQNHVGVAPAGKKQAAACSTCDIMAEW